MLHRIIIKNLFGLYTYDLDSLFTKECSIRFITGPNGYGKSTILVMLSKLMMCDFDYFKSLCFDKLQFYFDNRLIEIMKFTTSNSSIGEDISKVKADLLKDVKISLINIDKKSEDAFYLLSLGNDQDMGKMEIEMFLRGESHYYIKDQRLFWSDAWATGNGLVSSSSNAVNHNADCLKDKLTKCREEIRSILSFQSLSLKADPISENEYEDRKKRLIPTLNKMKSYGLASDGFVLPVYMPDSASLMRSFIEICEKAEEQTRKLILQIDLFKEIVDRSEFADKKCQISPEYGYRFVSCNQDRTLLDGSDLSSGEQHILIQTYELIFNAPEGSLALIDEPEMSFHMIWQMDYLKNLNKIAKLKNLQCLVATHSPQIFDSMWNLTYDLYELTHPKQEE